MPKLTKNAIEKATPEDKFVWCSTLPGFGVRIFPSGSKSFLIRTRENGRQKMITLGSVGVVELDQARDRAREIMQGLKLKKPLQDVLGLHAASPTVAELAKQHLAVAKVKESTRETYRVYWDKHIVPKLGKKEVNKITRLDIEKLHTGIDSIFSANRCVKLLSKAFNDMAEWGHPWPRIVNPAKNVQLHREHATERILNHAQAKALNEELVRRVTVDPFNYMAWLLLVLQVTGLRTGEWRKTPWSWVDLNRGELYLPTTKANIRRTVIIDPRVVRILEMIPVNPKSRWIFPSPENPKKYIGKPKKQWVNIKKVCKIDPKFRAHDIRHTFASFALVEGKISIKELGELLGHRQLTTTTRYLHLLKDHQVAATKKAVSAVLDFGNGDGSGT